MHLFDINLLLALLDPEHANHERATRWALARKDPEWATCELTWSGFIRVIGNPKATLNPRPAGQAWRMLRANLASPHHRYISLGKVRLPKLDRIFDRCQVHNQVTDALLIEIALGNDAVLATFDARLRHLSPRPEAVEIIPLL